MTVDGKWHRDGLKELVNKSVLGKGAGLGELRSTTAFFAQDTNYSYPK